MTLPYPSGRLPVDDDDGRTPVRGTRWRRFRRRRSAVVGAVIFAGLVLVALGEDVIAPGDPRDTTGKPFQAPSGEHWFGTNDLGRDVFSLVVHGARATLLVGLLTAALAAVIAAMIGGIAGFFGGVVDDLLMRLAELIESVPRFFLAILLATLFGPSQLVIVALLGATFWPDSARLVRSEILSVRSRDFVAASRSMGLSEWTILRRHILPAAFGVLVVSAALTVGAAVLTQAGLAFLGLADASTLSWGGELQVAQAFILLAWWPTVFPGVAISLLVVSINLAADGLLAAFAVRPPGDRVI